MKKEKFPTLYLSIDFYRDWHLLYNIKGDFSIGLKINNPCSEYCSDINIYNNYVFSLDSIIKSLGAGVYFQKFDILSKQKFHSNFENKSFMAESYFNHFNERIFFNQESYIFITHPAKKGFFTYDNKQLNKFIDSAEKIFEILRVADFTPQKLNKEELNKFIYSYYKQDFTGKCKNLDDIIVTKKRIETSEKYIQCLSLVDIDEVNLPNQISPVYNENVNESSFITDIQSVIKELDYENIVFHQMIFVPNQQKEIAKLTKKSQRLKNIPSPGNDISFKDIESTLYDIEKNNNLLVKIHYDYIVTGKIDNPVNNNKLENVLEKRGIYISRKSFNQFELFTNSFPGQSALYKEYDLFLTTLPVASSLQYKEKPVIAERTNYPVYYADRRGIPVSIDITGREGEKTYTTNSNFFCLGPSGSGKSFHMNSVVRQLHEYNSDIILVDCGGSYEGLCEIVKGKYITYSNEKPISMNPFLITQEELNNEKINFLVSLIAITWKGPDAELNDIENEILNLSVNTYYEYYFTPFNGYSPKRREERLNALLLNQYNNIDTTILTENIEKKVKKLLALADSGSGAEAELAYKKAEALKEKYKIVDDSLLPTIIQIDKQINEEEEYLRKIKIDSLSFNTFYEFALLFIPYVCKTRKLDFDIDKFSFLVSKFYKGGRYEKMLNQEVDKSLFDESFIVFEIDNIKEDKLLFGIVTLIIMDTYLQKMRYRQDKKKVLVIEEAWKAIASPVMAEYIQYLYKTARKWGGIIGVVTQEVEDVINSPIVKNAILNNSDITILLDQSKLKDRYDEVAKLLGLNEVEKSKIWTINKLNNKENRPYFSEVYIKRGAFGSVYGVEEAPECYICYTTDPTEKHARKRYLDKYSSYEEAILAMAKDWKDSGLSCKQFSNQILEKYE